MPLRFLDTNILLRYFTKDDEEKAQKALALLRRIERGGERVETSLPVIFETVFTLQRRYHVPKPQIRKLLLPLLRLRGIHLERKNLYFDALDLYVEKPDLSFADAFNTVFMKARGITEIYSFDTDFDEVEGITRLEPQP